MAKYNAKIEVTKEIDIWFEVPLFTGDIGNDIRMCFYENGQPYDMNGAQVTAVRADGEAVYDLAATEGNGAVITLKNNCYAQPGELSVYVTLTDAAGRAVTNGVLHFDVRRGYADGGGITADDRYPVLTELIDEVREALSGATGSNKTVSVTIAPYGGEGDYVCTGTGDEAIINQALNAATANGTKPATAVFMPGSYNLTGTINVPANVTVTAYQASFSKMEGSDNVVIAGNSVRWSGGNFSTAEFVGGLVFGNYATVRDISNGTYTGMTVGNYSIVVNCQDSSMNGLSFGSNCSITGCRSYASYAGYQSNGAENILTGNCYNGGNNGYMLKSGGFYPEDTTLFKALNIGKLIVDNTEV